LAYFLILPFPGLSESPPAPSEAGKKHWQ